MGKYVVVRNALIQETLAQPYTPGKKELEPFKSFALKHGLPYKIHEHPEEFQLAEVHMTESDLWICIEGLVEFVVGGKLGENPWFFEKDCVQNPHEIRSNVVYDGNMIFLDPGDHLWIPPGTPHMHRGYNKARSWIYKIPVAGK